MRRGTVQAPSKPPSWWTGFTDSDGHQWSWSRVICTIIIAFALYWGTVIVHSEHKIADFTSVALLIGAVYGVNRVGEALENRPASIINQPAPGTISASVSATTEPERQ